MTEENKTIAKLEEEVQQLRKRVKELEALKAAHGQVEETLKDFEQRYSALFENLNVGIYRVTPGEKGRFLEMNPAFIRIMGYQSKEEILKLNVSDVYTNPSGRKNFNIKISKQGFVKNEELKLNKKDGTPFIASDTGIAVYDNNNELIYFEGIIEDITERKKAEEALWESEKKYSNLIETIPDAITVTDLNGTILMVNQGSVKMHGCPKKEDLLGKNAFEFIGPESKEQLMKNMKKILEEGGERNIEYMMRDMAGNLFTADVSCSVVKDKDGKPKGLMAVVRNISERKKVERALKESEELYRTLVETSPDSITLTDMNGKIVMANQVALDIRDYSKKEELIGKATLDLVAPQDIAKAEKEMKETFKTGSVKGREYTLLKKDGTTFLSDVCVSLIKDTEGNPEFLMAVVRDISERKRIEKALKESEEQYRMLVETSPDSVTMTDIEGNFIMANQRALELHGCTKKEELLGRSAFDMIAPHDRERAIKNAEKTLINGGVKNIEYTLVRKDGSTFLAELSATLIKDAEDNPKALLGIVRDITERKKIEKALKESEEQYRMLIETSPDSITMLDLEGNVLMANQATVEIFGNIPIDEIVGKNAFDFISPQDKGKAEGDFKEILKSGNLKRAEYTIVKEDGSPFSIEVNVSLIKDGVGNPMAFMAIARDVTERKQIEEALAAEKERVTVTLRSIAEAVITVDIKGNIFLVNEVAENLTGWTQEKAIGIPLDKVLHIVSQGKRVRCDDLIRKVIETGEVISTIEGGILIAKDSTERTIAQSCAPIKDQDNKIVGVVLIIRDVTEKQKIEKELFKARKLESIGILAGGIAHDFNNILTGITSNLFMAKMDMKKETESYNCVMDAEKAAFRASKLTNQLLTFARGGEPIKESQSIREVIEEAVGFSLSGSNVDCKLKLPGDLWPLEIDRGQIDQVINNLVINADQAMPDGGTITVRGENIEISKFVSEGTNAYLPLEPGRYVRISMKDEGIGISPENIDKIYDPYFTTKDNGNGLGLTICYSILKKHNGLIFVKSKVGVGTIFHIYLPASDKKVQSERVKKELPLTGAGRILVMDDEEIVRIAVAHVLKIIGYEVTFALDGSEAIDAYKKAMKSGHPFEAVIMDLTIPGGMGGKEAIKKLLKIDPKVRAIVSSGYSTDPVMANYREYGFCGVVAKPYMVDELNEVLHEVIGEGDKVS